MKFSEAWLREWVNPPHTTKQIGEDLTMAGLEVEDIFPVEKELAENFQLDDHIIDISVTPNRGDCLSIRGVAREVAALTKTSLHDIRFKKVSATNKDKLPIKISMPEGCPHYVGRVIRHIDVTVPSPNWLKERLRRSGINSINVIVDVTNYVMLEIGQPMHAFDLAKISGGINVRLSNAKEKIKLLDESEKELDNETLVIADEIKPLAIAGVMGGLDSGVGPTTTDIFLESAFFTPTVIAKQRQFYNLNSESSYRFERGVDPQIQYEAIERATHYILELAGGEPGLIIEKISKKQLPQTKIILLSLDKINDVLGFTTPIKASEVESILKRLHFKVATRGGKKATSWKVTIPSYRFDLAIAEDLIEEIARLYGYHKIPTRKLKAVLEVAEQDTSINLYDLKQSFHNHGFHEIISYSFTEEKLQNLLDPHHQPLRLINPISLDMEVMRTSLWPGLIKTLNYNLSRQQHNIKLFEVGTCFIAETQDSHLAGVMAGNAFPEQWAILTRPVDFYDLKGNLETILKSYAPNGDITFKGDEHPALHPGQTAAIYFEDKKIGILGSLHPQIKQSLGFELPLFLFDVNLNDFNTTANCTYQEFSKYPEIRRDLALLVNETIPGGKIQDTIKQIAGDWLKEVFIFDVYQGKGVTPGQKSIALGLIWQHPTRTLVDEEVVELMGRVINMLKGKLGAELRS